MLFWTNPRSDTSQNSSSITTNFPSPKPSKENKDMWGNCWRSKDELISDIPLWGPTHGHINVGQPAKTYIHQLCVDTRYSLEDLPGTMNDRDGWQERIRKVCVVSMTWWYIYIYIYIYHLKDLELNNSQRLICFKTSTNQANQPEIISQHKNTNKEFCSVYHRTNTGSHPPILVKIRQVSAGKCEVAWAEFGKLQNERVIFPSKSEWSSQLKLAPK